MIDFELPGDSLPEMEVEMTRDDVQRWLDRYCDAWRTYDSDAIGDLFAEDADYRYHPWGDPVHGRAEIVRAWIAPGGEESSRDDPASWRAEYRPFALDGEVAIATGTTSYLKPDGSLDKTYENLWVLRFDEDGRCRDFTEWFMEQPAKVRAGASEAPPTDDAQDFPASAST